MQTIYGEIQDSLVARFRKIKLLFCDVDGVLTDGRIYMGNNGEELKAFHARDGFGVKVLQSSGVRVGVITGRRSSIVAERMSDLGVEILEQGCVNKIETFNKLVDQFSLSQDEVGFIGDDMPDIDCMKSAGLAIAVCDAHPAILNIADFVTRTPGGAGAVREVTDILMQCQNTFDQITASSTVVVSG